MTSLSLVLKHLEASQKPMQISLINTRVMLETGINLKQVSAAQDSDPAAVSKVLAVLREMGVAE